MAEEFKQLKKGGMPVQPEQLGDAWQARHAGRHHNGTRRVRVLSKEALRLKSESDQIRAIDAAAFLQRYPRPLSWLKLQDLLYLAQAWHLVWDEELLFSEPLTVTEDGVCIEAVDSLLNGCFEVGHADLRMAHPDRLGHSRERTLAGILDFYGSRSHYRLAEQIRQDPPWQQARTAGPGTVIEPGLLYRHYRTL